MKTISFWYEFASTYSYLSVMRIEDLAKERGVQIEWRPFLLGPIFQAQGWADSPFNLFPSKGRYMWRDMQRLCEQQNISFRKPTQFPRNGLLAARVALYGSQYKWCPQFTRAVFRANFVKDQDISDTSIIEAILQELQLDPQTVIKESLSEENKRALRQQTTQAEQLGIFGAPSFIVGNELFWGHDRLAMAFDYLDEE